MENTADWTRVVTVDLGPHMEWVCQMEWPEGETQGGPGMLVIRPADVNNYPAGGISQTLLREVDFRSALEALRRQLEFSDRWGKQTADSRNKMESLLLSHAQGRDITDTYLALLSRAYVNAVSTGQDKPLEYLSTLTGKSYAAIKNHLWQATRRGLLERSPGRAGGKVTGKAANLIADLIDAPFESPEQTLERLNRPDH
jgi:hypothetical protein